MKYFVKLCSTILIKLNLNLIICYFQCYFLALGCVPEELFFQTLGKASV